MMEFSIQELLVVLGILVTVFGSNFLGRRKDRKRDEEVRKLKMIYGEEWGAHESRHNH